MKRLLTILLVLIAVQSYGQRYMDTNNPREIKSLLSEDNQLDGFGGGDLKVTDLIDERAMLLGAYGGVLINRHYMLGLAGYGIATRVGFKGVVPTDSLTRSLDLYGGYAGVLIGGTIWAKEVMHISIPIIMGAGQIQVSDNNFFFDQINSDYTIEQSAFFVVEPGLQLEFNITPTFRIGAGATYRWVKGIELENVEDEDMTNWAAVISLRFGRF